MGDEEDEGERARRERALASKRRSTTMALPVPATAGPSNGSVPAIDSKVTDAFCDPNIAKMADPGVIAAHAMRFMELKRKFRGKEFGGTGGRDRSRSRSRSRRRR